MPDSDEIPVLAYGSKLEKTSSTLNLVISLAIFGTAVFWWSLGLLADLFIWAHNVWVHAGQRSKLTDLGHAISDDLWIRPLAFHIAVCIGLWTVVQLTRTGDLAGAIRRVLASGALTALPLFCASYFVVRGPIAKGGYLIWFDLVFAASAGLLVTTCLFGWSKGPTRRFCTLILVFSPLLLLAPILAWVAFKWCWYFTHILRLEIPCVLVLPAVCILKYSPRLRRHLKLSVTPELVDALAAAASMAATQFGLALVIIHLVYGISVQGRVRHPEINLVHVPLLLVDAGALYCLYCWRVTCQRARP